MTWEGCGFEVEGPGARVISLSLSILGVLAKPLGHWINQQAFTKPCLVPGTVLGAGQAKTKRTRPLEL